MPEDPRIWLAPARIHTEELYDNSNVKLLSSVQVTVEHQDQGGLALSLRESLIIEDLNPGPYRRSTRVRAKTQRLELSATGVKCDEITAEEFSEEFRHALESSVSELSLWIRTVSHQLGACFSS